MIKNIIERNTLIKYMLMITCLLLFIAGGYRAFNLYRTYKSYNQEVEAIEERSDNQMHTILRAIITEGKESIAYSTKTDAVTLHRLMVESMTMDEIYNNIVNMNLGDKLINIFNDLFNLQNSQENVIITVGTKDHVIYSKSNIDLDKYKYLDTNGKQYLTWDEYYEQLEDTGVLQQAYEDISLNRVEYAIIRTDGYYPENRYYTIEDVIQDYHNNGTKNLDKYLLITLGVITDDGDIFGEKDSDYLNMNTKVNKIYIFKSVSIGTFIKNYEDLIKSCDESMSARIIQYRNSTEFSNGLVNIFLITSSIISIMIVIKSLDDENIEINNTDIDSKEENSEEESD